MKFDKASRHEAYCNVMEIKGVTRDVTGARGAAPRPTRSLCRPARMPPTYARTLDGRGPGYAAAAPALRCATLRGSARACGCLGVDAPKRP